MSLSGAAVFAVFIYLFGTLYAIGVAWWFVLLGAAYGLFSWAALLTVLGAAALLAPVAACAPAVGGLGAVVPGHPNARRHPGVDGDGRAPDHEDVGRNALDELQPGPGHEAQGEQPSESGLVRSLDRHDLTRLADPELGQRLDGARPGNASGPAAAAPVGLPAPAHAPPPAYHDCPPARMMIWLST